MDHQDELKEISPLLQELHQKGLPQKGLPSDTWFDHLHEDTLKKMAPNRKQAYFHYALRIAALLTGVFLTHFFWNQKDSKSTKWEEDLATIETEELATFIESNIQNSVLAWEEEVIGESLYTELFENLTEEEMEPFLSHALIQMNEIVLYNILNSNL